MFSNAFDDITSFCFWIHQKCKNLSILRTIHFSSTRNFIHYTFAIHSLYILPFYLQNFGLTINVSFACLWLFLLLLLLMTVFPFLELKGLAGPNIDALCIRQSDAAPF